MSSETRTSLAQRFISKYVGTEIDVDELKEKGYPPKGRIVEIFFRDCNVGVNIVLKGGKINKASDHDTPVGRLTTDLDTLEYLRMGKERVLVGGEKGKEEKRGLKWRPYNVLDAYRYGDFKIEGELTTGDVALVSKALEEVVRPMLENVTK